MNSGVNKCITMRLLKNILHYILIININKALKLTLSNKPILLNTMNASHLRTKFWVIMIKYILVYWIIQYINCSFKLNTIGPLITIHSRKKSFVYVLYSLYAHIHVPHSNIHCIFSLINETKSCTCISISFISSIIMALNNLLDQDKKIWISHCD